MADANGHGEGRASVPGPALRGLQADARGRSRGSRASPRRASRRRRCGARPRPPPTSCAEVGIENVQVLEIPGVHPYVYGDWLTSPARPRILLYGHHDVQPPGRPEKWHSPAFEPTEREGPPLRARHRRRQGGRHGPRGRRRLLPAVGGRAPLQREVPDRGRGGDRLREPRPLPREVQGHDDGRLHRPVRHRQLRHRHPRAHLPAARDLQVDVEVQVPRPPAAQRHVGRAGARPRAGPVRADRRPDRQGRQAQRPRPVREVAKPSGKQTKRIRAAALRREEVQARRRAGEGHEAGGRAEVLASTSSCGRGRR